MAVSLFRTFAANSRNAGVSRQTAIITTSYKEEKIVLIEEMRKIVL